MEPNTSTLNNFLWYLFNLILLMGPFAMFITVELTSWKHTSTKGVVGILLIIGLWIFLVCPTYYLKGPCIGYWLAAFLRIDSFWGIRMLKIGFYSFIYLKYGAPQELYILIVYIPVGYSTIGILISKLYGYRSRHLIIDFGYILTPLLAERISSGHKLKGSFLHRYTHALLFVGVIILAMICTLLPRVVPPRIHYAAPEDLEAGNVVPADPIVAAPADPIAAAPAAPKPTGTWTLSELLHELGVWLGDASAAFFNRAEWIKWSNPGKIEYHEFYQMEEMEEKKE